MHFAPAIYSNIFSTNCTISAQNSDYILFLSNPTENFRIGPVQGRYHVTAALRVTLRDMTETYVAVAWDRAVPDDHAS